MFAVAQRALTEERWGTEQALQRFRRVRRSQHIHQRKSPFEDFFPVLNKQIDHSLRRNTGSDCQRKNSSNRGTCYQVKFGSDAID